MNGLRLRHAVRMAEGREGGLERPSASPARPRMLLVLLVGVVLANYAAQVPYYFILYFPRPPSLLGTALLTATLAWFLVGLLLYGRGLGWGRALLAGFLATEVLFYGGLIVLGALTGGRGGAAAQLTTHDARLWAIFAIGYVNFLAALAGLVGLLTRRGLLEGRGTTAA